MVSPTTGPFYESWARFNVVSGQVLASMDRKVYRQARPYNLPLPYEADFSNTLSRNGDPTNSNVWMFDQQVDNAMKIAAYDKFKDKISDRASMGVSLIEAHKSLQMVADRAFQLLAFGKALKQGQFKRAARILKMPGERPPRGVSGRKSVANNYMEFHFGWAPAVNDIYSAVNVLQSPLKKYHIRTENQTVIEGLRPAPGAFSAGRTWEILQTIKYGADVYVSNPNLWLANQLGLLNPLSVINEVIPFSFIADWFFNVSQFLESGTDMVGLTLNNPYTMMTADGLVHCIWTNYNWTSEVRQLRVKRTLGIDLPSFGLRKMKLWGWRRAAAAVSLVVQQQKTLR